MAGHGFRLPRKQEQLITSLLSHSSIAQAAGAIGISEGTAGRWMKDPAFQAAYAAARAQLLTHGVALMHQHIMVAVLTLRQCLTADNAPWAVRIAAASKILDIALKFQEMSDFLPRLEALEAAVDAQQKEAAYV